MRRLTNLTLFNLGNGQWTVNVDIDGVTHTYDPYCLHLPGMTLRQARQLISRIKSRGAINRTFWEPVNNVLAA